MFLSYYFIGGFQAKQEDNLIQSRCNLGMNVKSNFLCGHCFVLFFWYVIGLAQCKPLCGGILQVSLRISSTKVFSFPHWYSVPFFWFSFFNFRKMSFVSFITFFNIYILKFYVWNLILFRLIWLQINFI